ncbi:MAG: hypothetical protein V4684_04380 [Pseudomonadota bacterium]
MKHLHATSSQSGEPRLSLPDSILRFERQRPAPYEKAYAHLDLAKLWLPSTPFCLEPTPIASHPDIVSVINDAIRLVSGRIAPSKTKHHILASYVRAYTRVYEHGWYIGCYSLTDFTEVHMQRLAAALAVGGWYKALDMSTRVAEYIRRAPSQVRSLLQIKDGIVHLRYHQAARALGTCLSARELSSAKLQLAQACGLGHMPMRGTTNLRHKPVHEAGPSSANLAAQLNALNTLFDVPGKERLLFVPFNSPLQTGEKSGRPNGRTPDISPEQMAALLTESFRCIEKTGEPLARVCEELLELIGRRKAAGKSIASTIRWKLFRQCTGTRTLDEILGRPIENLKHEKVKSGPTLYSMLEDLYTSCFIILGILNARRKDEIAGTGIGLMTSSLRLVDEGLSLYECEFYIEKTHHGRIPFFVGEATAQVIKLLTRLSRYAVEFRSLLGDGLLKPGDDHSIFLMPFTGQTGLPQAYQFSARPKKSAERLVLRALGTGEVLLGAHVFRRCYALLFHYRYENSDLLSLTHQLAHFDVDAARVYITDARGGTSCGDAFRRLTPDQRKARIDDLDQIGIEVLKVSDERLEALAREVIEGKARYSGGFAPFVQRFHQMSWRHIEYRRLTAEQQATRLASSLIARGHQFSPMVHGHCVASARAASPSAKCFSKQRRQLDRAEASAQLCASCPFHLVSEVQVDRLEEQVRTMTRDTAGLAGATVQGVFLSKQIANLMKAIALHRNRMQGVTP